jgi:hypothetical protein
MSRWPGSSAERLTDIFGVIKCVNEAAMVVMIDV